MNWNDIRVFLAIAREGQILAAARRLGLNHATAGRRLDALEAALEARLFTRHPHGCDLTEAGRGFLTHAERMESEMLAALGQVHSEGGTLSGTVRIGCPDGFGGAFLAPQIGRLAERHPSLVLELVPVPRNFSLSRREADIVITIGRPQSGKLIARKLTDYVLGLYASKDYLEQRGMPAGPADLAAHRLVGYVEDLVPSPALDYARQYFKDWRSQIAVSTAMGQLAVVRSGAGIGILHRFMARSCPDLVPVLPQEILTRSYWILVHQDLHPSPTVRLVADFIGRVVAENRASFV